MKKILLEIILIIILLMLLTVNSYAAGNVTLSTNKSSVEIGDEFSVSVNFTGMSVASLTVKVSVDTSKVQYVSGPGNSNFSNGKAIYTWTDSTGGLSPKTGGTIVTFRFKAIASGTASFGVTGEFYDPEENFITSNYSGTSISIKAPVIPENNVIVEPPVVNENKVNNTPVEQPPIVENNVSQPDNTTTVPENNVEQPIPVLSNNANLKSLQLNVEGLSPSFNKNILSYNVIISEAINEISVTAIPEDSRATVNITGNRNLTLGMNYIKISVTAEDGKTKKTYVINTTKTNDADNANANLENLAIENVLLNPIFDANIVDYSIEIPNDINSLNILAIPQIEGADVKISGNENLIISTTPITVVVIAKDGITKKTYTILVQKQEELTENNIINTIENNVVNEYNEFVNDEGNNTWKLIGIIVVFVLLAAGIVITIFKIYTNK